MLDLAALPDLTFPPLWRWTTKWGYFLGLAALIGSLVTHVAVVRPALARHADPEHEARGRTAMYRAIGAASLLMLVVALLQSVSTVARAAKTDFSAALAPGTWWAYHSAAPKKGDWLAAGWLSLAQVGLAVACALLLVPLLRGAPSRRREHVVSFALVLSLALTLVKSVPLGPDALEPAALSSKLLVQAHIIGGSIWAGGLVALFALTRTRHHIRSTVVDTWVAIWHRFGVAAMASVTAILVSGAWMTYREVGAVDQLWTTSFGIMLSAKLALVALLLVAGGVNRLLLMPRIERARRAGQVDSAWRLAIRHLGRAVTVESVLVVGVLLTASLLNGSAREQAGDAAAGPLDGTLLGYGVGILVLLVAAMWATAKVSTVLAARAAGGSHETPTPAHP